MYQKLMNPIVIIPVISVIVVTVILGYIIHHILQNPFHYPYFTYIFDVSNKRNVCIEDYIDRYLCDERNWYNLVQYHNEIEQWKFNTEKYLRTCRLKKRRVRQYQEILDDDGAFHFETVRGQTRYKQKNYLKTAYKVNVFDGGMAVSWPWLLYRYEQLRQIGFQATLKEYYCKNQRKVMNKELRRYIIERDNYTCQNCGKYMPDEVGLHIDHIIPIAKGGKTVPSNLQVLCSKCNGRKGAR